MRALVVSDTHGHFAYLSKVSQMHQINPFDEIWHLGDFFKDAQGLSKALNLPVYAVKGNCDPQVVGHETLVLDRMGYKVFLTHGHLHEVKASMMRLFYAAKEGQYDLVCFGHTHLPLDFVEDGVHLFNPGSFSKPYPGEAASFGIVSFEEGVMKTELIYV